MALERIYSRQGWAVDVAGSVTEAFDLLRRCPDFVILDLMLPDGDGTEVLRAIRAAGLPIRVVVTTGLDDRARNEAVHSLGPDLFLLKPIALSDLDDAMRRLG
jgi:two-component system response regulator TctD